MTKSFVRLQHVHVVLLHLLRVEAASHHLMACIVLQSLFRVFFMLQMIGWIGAVVVGRFAMSVRLVSVHIVCIGEGERVLSVRIVGG